jgi:flavin reductase (DIM6/NTAB) family NADH-FMN oxidoreductase RutF
MKKNKLGARPYIYPMPVVMVGALVDGTPNFITVAYIGIVQHNPPMVSVTLFSNHYTNKGIAENKTFSVNIPNTKMMKLVDYVGMNSGRNVDKASLFKIFYGELKTAPMIMETPLNLECKLVDTIDLNNNNKIYLGEIVQTYSSKKYTKKGYPYMRKLDPILFSINSNSYYNIGRRIGWAWRSGLKIKNVKKKNANPV